MTVEKCRACTSKCLIFIEDTGDGIGKYRCNDCGATIIDDSPFVELTDSEASILSELAFGTKNEKLEEKLINRREFAQGDCDRFRSLVAGALDSGAAERYFDKDEVQELYDRLTALLFPESAASD